MANTILTSSVVARAALATLYDNTVMLPLVYRDYEPEFQAGRGATITVRKPATFTATEYNGTTISIQNATETGVPVVLNHHRDVSFAVTSRDMALNIIDFNEQFLRPAMEALFQAIDEDILAFRSDITAEVGTGVTPDPLWSNVDTIVAARTVLSQAKVPLDMNRHLVVPSEISGEWLKDPMFSSVDEMGDTAGLREASLGRRVRGFNPYETENADGSIGVAFHQTAVAFASRPLQLPRGAADASIQNYKGVGLRTVFTYDANLKSDICSIDVLYGVKTLDKNRAVLINASGS